MPQWQTYSHDNIQYTPEPEKEIKKNIVKSVFGGFYTVMFLINMLNDRIEKNVTFSFIYLLRMLFVKSLTKVSIFRKSDEIRIDITLFASGIERKHFMVS